MDAVCLPGVLNNNERYKDRNCLLYLNVDRVDCRNKNSAAWIPDLDRMKDHSAHIALIKALIENIWGTSVLVQYASYRAELDSDYKKGYG